MIADRFKPMLAKDPGDLDELRFPQMIQPKLDGVRATVVDDRLVSRNLKLIPNAEIQAALGRPEFEGLDGELIVGDPRDPDAFRTTSSFVRSESKTGAPWTFYVFDLWNHPGTNRERNAALLARLALLSEDGEPTRNGTISLVSTQDVNDAGELERIEALFLAEGFEGAILRDPEAKYKFGRSGKTGPLLKVKRFIDFEAEVIGVYEEMHNDNPAMTNALGRTERSTHAAGMRGKGTLGGLILRALNGPAEGVEFRCGTGFDAHQRAELWAIYVDGAKLGLDPEASPIGRTAKIKSFPIGVKDKPRHPVFLGWRDLEIDG